MLIRFLRSDIFIVKWTFHILSDFVSDFCTDLFEIKMLQMWTGFQAVLSVGVNMGYWISIKSKFLELWCFLQG